MSTRNDILDQMKSDIEAYVDNSRLDGDGNQIYLSDVEECKRGIHLFEDFPTKPAISFWCWQDIVGQHLQGTPQERVMHIRLFGYANTDGLRDVGAIHNLADDLEYFFYNEWTYRDQTLIDEIIIYEGGTLDPASVFEMKLRVQYYKS